MATLLRIGTKVRTFDRGARVHGRAPDKPEAIGTIQDHYRPYGRQSKDRTPPYYVTFETGEAAWYDASEVERLQGSRSSHPAGEEPHATRKTSPAQLEREIVEALARPAALANEPSETGSAFYDFLIERFPSGDVPWSWVQKILKEHGVPLPLMIGLGKEDAAAYGIQQGKSADVHKLANFLGY